MVDVLALFDTDGDKDLDVDEREYLMKTTKYFAGDDEKLQQGEIDDMKKVMGYFDDLDGTKDGKLSKDEFQAMVDVLALFDEDGNGYLDKKELPAMMKRIEDVLKPEGKAKLTKEMVKSLLKKGK